MGIIISLSLKCFSIKKSEIFGLIYFVLLNYLLLNHFLNYFSLFDKFKEIYQQKIAKGFNKRPPKWGLLKEKFYRNNIFFFEFTDFIP